MIFRIKKVRQNLLILCSNITNTIKYHLKFVEILDQPLIDNMMIYNADAMKNLTIGS